MKVCSLFSGGKDSSYALARADERYGVDTVATVRAREASMMYHVPAAEAAKAVAEASDAEHVEVEEGDDETEPLHEIVERAEPDLITTGAVASEYQSSRIEKVADEHGVDVFSPLWNADPVEALSEIVDEFDVVVTAVAAEGLGELWLGRRLDGDAVEELVEISDEYGVHPMGEGGEYETLAVAGPHIDGRLELEYEKEWDGVRGQLRLTEVDVCRQV